MTFLQGVSEIGLALIMMKEGDWLGKTVVERGEEGRAWAWGIQMKSWVGVEVGGEVWLVLAVPRMCNQSVVKAQKESGGARDGKPRNRAGNAAVGGPRRDGIVVEGTGQGRGEKWNF